MAPQERRLDPRFPGATQRAFAEGKAQEVDADAAVGIRRDGVWAGSMRMELPIPIFSADGKASVTFLVHDGVLYADVIQSGPADEPIHVLYSVGRLADLDRVLNLTGN
jgi:hypothetical protein